MDWTRGSDDWNAENERLRIEFGMEDLEPDAEYCRACRKWHDLEYDCD